MTKHGKMLYGSQTTDYTYNLANLLTEVNNANGSTQISKYSYTYYVDGNQKSKTESVAGTNKGTTNYTYDGLNRLVQEEAPDNTYSYQYDSYGNRSQLSVTGDENYTTSYTYDKNNRMRKQTKTVGTSSEITDFWYDPNGNQISSMTVSTGGTGTAGVGIALVGADNTSSYSEYNSWNQLTKTMQNGNTASYTYNGDGLRMSKTVNGTTTSHIWDGTNIAADVSGSTVTKYIRGLQLISSKKGSNESFYTYNGHGDVVQLTNGSGSITKQYGYDAFGVETDKADNDTNPFRYCGEYYDTETDSIYLRARYYRPITGRFITEDPIRDGLNWYVYCSGNPVMLFDPWGLGAEFRPILEEQHDNTDVYLREMFDMHAGDNDYISVYNDRIYVSLNGRGQTYYYNTNEHESVHGNYMDGNRMKVDAVDFAYHFGLVEERRNDGNGAYTFLTPGDAAFLKSADANWSFGINYVNSPRGKIITYQWFECRINSWAYTDDKPIISVRSRVDYTAGNTVVRSGYLFEHSEDYIIPIGDASNLYKYRSGQHLLLPANTNKADVSFSIVAGISTKGEPSIAVYF